MFVYIKTSPNNPRLIIFCNESLSASIDSTSTVNLHPNFSVSSADICSPKDFRSFTSSKYFVFPLFSVICRRRLSSVSAAMMLSSPFSSVSAST